MTPAQIVACAETLVNTREFNILHLEDYPVFFERCLSGEYGPIEYSIDQLKICVMLRKFIADWNAQQAKNRESANNNIYEVFQYPVMIDAMKGVVESLDVKTKPTEHLKIRELSEQEKLIQTWISDFDRLYNETTDDKSNPVRVVYYEGQNLDLQGFLKLKSKEYEESNQNQE